MDLQQVDLPEIEQLLDTALELIRVGKHDEAEQLAGSICSVMEKRLDGGELTIPWEGLDADSQKEQVQHFRAATLGAELADYRGDRERARAALKPLERIREHLKTQRQQQAHTFIYSGKDDAWRLLRQELFGAWQFSVLAYRDGDVREARRILSSALYVAEVMEPRSDGLLTQLYYADAKLCLHDRDFLGATRMFQRSLVKASERFAAAGENVVERNAAQYSVGKAMALGLAQSLLDQGRTEEAHTIAVAGCMLLELTPDIIHRHYALQLLACTRRASVRDAETSILQSTRKDLETCALFFENLNPPMAYRARYELALISLHLDDFSNARWRMQSLRDDAAQIGHKKWEAMCHIGLSRIARKAKEPGQAVIEARRACDIAEVKESLKAVELKARTVWIQALFDEAGGDAARLKTAEREVRLLLHDVPEVDVRSRVVGLLVLARVLAAQKNLRQARVAFEEYERVKYQIQSRRIDDLAAEVLEEMFPPLETFRCPADDVRPNFKLEANQKALYRHVFEKVRTYHQTVSDRADALGIAKTTYHDRLNELGGE